MTLQELTTYIRAEDNNRPFWISLIVAVIVIALAYILADRPNQYFNFYYLLLLLFIPVYNLFRSRTCNTCGIAMKRFYYALLPKYYYCEKCKKKVQVEIIWI